MNYIIKNIENLNILKPDFGINNIKQLKSFIIIKLYNF